MTARALAVGLLAWGAAPAPAQGVVADTTDPASYYPLHVGDAWMFASFYQAQPSLQKREILGDTTVAGFAYVVERRCGANAAARAWRCSDLLVRYDSASTDVRSRHPGGEEGVLHCALDADFGATVPCRGGDTSYTGGYGGSLWIRDDEVPIPASKAEELPVDPPEPPLVAGIGPTPRDVYGPLSYSEFLYALVDGERYGYPAALDPEPPARYAPLAVGNVWEYRETRGGVETRTGRAIVADSVVGGRRYVVQQSLAEADGGVEVSTALVRFDSTTTRLVERRADGQEVPVSCPLGAPYGVTLPGCFDPALGDGYLAVSVSGHAVSPGVGVRVGRRTAPMTSFKTFYRPDDGPSVTYGAGIGRLPQTRFPDCPTGCSEEMTYLRLVGPDGSVREYGARDLVVAGATRPGPLALAVEASPNPVGSVLVLGVTAAAVDVRVEVFDARGRRVEGRTVRGGGTVAVRLDAAGWAPGLYLVRATAGEHEATARVVRP